MVTVTLKYLHINKNFIQREEFPTRELCENSAFAVVSEVMLSN